MKHVSSKFALLAATSILACSSGEGASDSEQPHIASAAQTETLASVDVGYGSIDFYKTTSEDGKVIYGVSEMASAYATQTPFSATMAEKPHTLLEIFKAVAPDQEPPAELVASHPAEAKRLKRTTDAVEPAAFDKNAPVQKALQACVNFIWQGPSSNCYAWKNKLELTTTGEAWLPVGTNTGDYDHPTGEAVTMGVCNGTGTPTVGHTVFTTDPTGYSYSFRNQNVAIAAYTQWRDWWVSNAVWGPDCTGSPVCFPNLHPARYAVIKNAGANATLMSAESYYTGGCNI